MSKSIIFLPAANLAKSPVNVRKRTDPRADAELEASIASHGLLQNLVAVPVARKKGQYRITAGGRRLDAIHRLIEKSLLPADYEVPVQILSNAKDGREISLAENFDRLQMNPAEECRAFRDLLEVEGRTPAEIAKRFGIEERFVLGRLRLANLAEPIFDALEGDEITLDIAKAYATTADTGRQTAVWELLRNSYSRDNVNEIRRSLNGYSYRASDPKALLVGRDAYIAAGGRVEDADLFSTAADERWIDTHILDELAEARLAAEAELIRQREGIGEVRIVTGQRIPYMETYALEPLTGVAEPLTDEEENRKQEIEQEIAVIEQLCEDADYEPEADDETRYTALQDELAAIVERVPVVAPEQKASALAYVMLGADGTPHVHHQLYVAPVAEEEGDGAKDGNEEDGDEEPVDGEQDADTAEDDRPAISQRLRDMLAMMKTELLAVHVASDPAFALDLGTFIMVDRECRYAAYDVPSELRASTAPRLLGDFKPETSAAAEWARLDEALDRSWAAHRAIEERYDAFCALDDEARAAWLGWAIARTLHAVPDGRNGTGFLNHLGRKLGIDVAAWWRPTALTFFDKLTKPGILALFEEIGGVELRARYAGSKKHDLAASAERLFSGNVVVEHNYLKRALAWLPDGMRFTPAEAENDGMISAEIEGGLLMAAADEAGEVAENLSIMSDEDDGAADDTELVQAA
ncbi:ParB/RepB/Spo0J family partition protein [Novosphingobium sp. SG707]|uniref:ParB/RepB/Spo0J family partition protein n=1 Tax=Novosphingobium sp. SG707 TaxID=2586996 RepID=UPI001445C3BE|nr:ParB/RepB/Spo0J family partition protein [Novosphingobium sp. SG707]NKJ02450.1 ParB family chromosome partitioning protein [Novosphingobium sp. SG707]